MASDTGGARLNRIEIPAHREALAKALRKRYEEMAAGPAPAGRILSRPGSRGIVKYAVPALAAIALCATVLAVLVVSWPGGGGTDRTTRTVMTGSQALAAREEARATGFDFALFKEVSGGVPGNVVLSPLSARMALAMAYNGASDEVAGEMAYVLDFEGMDLDDVNAMMRGLIDSLLQADEDQVQLELANSIWSDDGMGFTEDFRERCVDNYFAEVASVDFGEGESAGIINRWVEEKTQGKITDIVDASELEDLGDLVAMLINTLYFKGDWTRGFDASMDAEGPFRLAGGGTKEVVFMRQAGRFDYLENEVFQAVRLPYGNERLGMYVFLPREGRSLEDFTAGLDLAGWDEWMASFSRVEGEIALPYFGTDFEADLSPALVSLGMGSAFGGDALPGMFAGKIDGPGPFMEKVVQKTSIGVNGVGTEAAAATVIHVRWCGLPEQVQGFVMEVDRPFFFAISDNETGTILFMGSIYEP
ncbi:MAG: serpin family protein [Actinomycetota bacterium]|nr:serpin family protein [Actinomycetota bacterium]MDD5666236.1 serpin family protein [Actinomycetota bacterium]